MKSGCLFTISAPSGTGKGTLIEAFLAQAPNFKLSVSYTTRAKRKGEINGVHYFFVNQSTFEQMIADDHLLEYEKVFDHYYGTSRQSIQTHLAQTDGLLLEIDYKGALQIKQSYQDSIGIFLLPPSFEALQSRLKGRGRETEAEINYRLKLAAHEASFAGSFDYCIINDDFDQTLNALIHIIHAAPKQTRYQNQAWQAILSDLQKGSDQI